jgi:hypothetical protein
MGQKETRAAQQKTRRFTTNADEFSPKVRTVRSTLEPLAAEKKLAFNVELAPNLPMSWME